MRERKRYQKYIENDTNIHAQIDGWTFDAESMLEKSDAKMMEKMY